MCLLERPADWPIILLIYQGTSRVTQRRNRKHKRIPAPDAGPINLGIFTLLDGSESSSEADPVPPIGLPLPRVEGELAAVNELPHPNLQTLKESGAQLNHLSILSESISINKTVDDTSPLTDTAVEAKPVAMEAVPPEAVSDSALPSAFIPELEELFAQGKFTELLSTTEARLQRGDEVESRVWWVRSQVALGVLPGSLIGARFDSIVQQLGAGEYKSAVTRDSLQSLVGLAFEELARRVSSRGDAAGAQDLRQRALAMTILPSVHKTDIRQLLSSIQAPTPAARDTTPFVRKEPAESFRAVREAPGREIQAEHAPAETPAPNEESAMFVQDVAAQSLFTHLRSWGALATLGGLTVVGAFLFLSGSDDKPPGEYAHADLPALVAPVSHSLALQGPTLELIPAVNALASLVYEIESGKLAAPAPRVAPSRQVVAQPPVPAPVIEPVAVQKGEREKILIDKATEPAAVRALESAPEVPEESIGFDFPPYRDQSRSIDPNLGGGQGQTRVVEKFSSPRTFTIIAPTRVMESPSYWSDSRGALDIGDEIAVEAKVGVWLKFKTPRGEYAYILAQDAQR